MTKKEVASYALPLAAYMVMLILLAILNRFDQYIYVLLLALPLFDKSWLKSISLQLNGQYSALYVLCISVTVGLLALSPDHINYFIMMALFVAFPEEWFFRAYLLCKFRGGVGANMVVSLAFSLLHAVSHGVVVGCLVFLPSLLFGYFYLKTKDIYLTALVHALSNLVFILLIRDWLSNQSTLLM